jgi:acyl-CoA hydrolase
MRIVDPSRVSDAVSALAASLQRPLRVLVSGNFATPRALLDAVDTALPEYRLNVLNAQPGIPDRDGVVHETSFVGPGMRRSPRLAYVPCRLSLLPRLLALRLVPDVVVLHCSRPVDGKISLGVEVNVLPAAVEVARRTGGLVLAQINPAVPYTFGDSELDLEVIDLAIEHEAALASPAPSTPSQDALHIGELIAARVLDGSTLQLGIGAIPDAALAGLTTRSGLRVWSEMVGDGLVRLDRAGALDPATPAVASFMFGSPELYRWADRNPRLLMRRTEVVNSPGAIAQQPAMTSINSALQVDLFAQANASRREARIHSGFGGATDFLVGALHSRGGSAYIALPSWHPKAQVSTVVPLIDEPVTSVQPTAIVTEQGLAQVWGLTEREQAEQIISRAAHPDVRDELAEEAGSLGLA